MEKMRAECDLSLNACERERAPGEATLSGQITQMCVRLCSDGPVGPTCQALLSSNSPSHFPDVRQLHTRR